MIFYSAYAQTWLGSTTTNDLTYRDGNVLIGATSFSGSYASTERILQLQGEGTNLSMISTTTGGSFNLAYSGTYGTGLYSRAAQISFWTSPTVSGGLAERMRIGTDGNVGIGTTIPQAKLDVSGDIRWGSAGSMLKLDQGGAIELRGTGVPYVDFSNDASSDYDARMILQSDDILVIDGANVGIGTSDPGSFKLAVEGKIGAREVQVTITNPWPDYVFQEDYELPSLMEVASFIKQNKHLPEIPPSEEIQRNGHKLGEMDVLLLKKIEELTLYLIELKKENEGLKKDISELQNR